MTDDTASVEMPPAHVPGDQQLLEQRSQEAPAAPVVGLQPQDEKNRL